MLLPALFGLFVCCLWAWLGFGFFFPPLIVSSVFVRPSRTFFKASLCLVCGSSSVWHRDDFKRFPSSMPFLCSSRELLISLINPQLPPGCRAQPAPSAAALAQAVEHTKRSCQINVYRELSLFLHFTQGQRIIRAGLEITFQCLPMVGAQILLETILWPPKPGWNPGRELQRSEGATQPLSQQGAGDSASPPSEGRSAEASNCCRLLFLYLYSGQDI